MKIRREIPDWVEIGQKYWTLYTNTEDRFTVAGDINLP
jgi:hypothetical protein